MNQYDQKSDQTDQVVYVEEGQNSSGSINWPLMIAAVVVVSAVAIIVSKSLELVYGSISLATQIIIMIVSLVLIGVAAVVFVKGQGKGSK